MNHTPTPTKRMAVNLIQKSQLAKLLATENINVVHSHTAETASFETNTRTLTLPVWGNASEDVYDLLVAHEIGHALITPGTDIILEACRKALPEMKSPEKNFFPYLNIVEDIRVDDYIKTSFPGSKRAYFNGMKELLDADLFGVNKLKNDFSSLSFGDRLNLYTKVGIFGFLDVSFSDSEMEIVNEAMAVKSFEDVCAVAKKVYDMSNHKKCPEDKPGEGENNQKDSSNDNSGSGSGSGDEYGNQDGQHGQPREMGGLITDQAYSNSIAALRPKESSNYRSKEYHYYDFPKMCYENIIFTPSQIKQDLAVMRANTGFSGNIILNNIKKRNANYVSNLVKQFEQKMAADESRRVRISRTGRLDMRRIHEYKFSDDLCLKNQILPTGKSHGMVFFMDWSGSMSEKLLPTVEQLIVLCMFCRKMNIPFEVYAFTSRSPKFKIPVTPCSKDYTLGTNKYTGNDTVEFGNYLGINRFGLINFLSSTMNSTEYQEAAEMLCQLASIMDSSGSDLKLSSLFSGPLYNPSEPASNYQLSSTPLSEAIFAAIELVNNFKAKNSLEIVNTIVLSDGEPTSSLLHKTTGFRGSTIILNLPNKKQFVLRDDYDGITPSSIPGYYDILVNEMMQYAKLFREMTNCNLINIYMKDSRSVTTLLRSPRANEYWCPSSEKERMQMNMDWKQNRFLSSNSTGFTSVFVIDSNIEVMDEDQIFAGITNNHSSKITQAFIKGNMKKTNSRVLLNRFTDLIAKKVIRAARVEG